MDEKYSRELLREYMNSYPDYRLKFLEGSYKADKIEDLGTIRDVLLKHEQKTILCYLWA